jgi:hypothetical protein
VPTAPAVEGHDGVLLELHRERAVRLSARRRGRLETQQGVLQRGSRAPVPADGRLEERGGERMVCAGLRLGMLVSADRRR